MAPMIHFPRRDSDCPKCSGLRPLMPPEHKGRRPGRAVAHASEECQGGREFPGPVGKDVQQQDTGGDQRGPMTEPKPANDGDDDGTAYFRPSGSARGSSASDPGGPVQRDFERGLSLARLTVLLPVVVLVLSGGGGGVF